jgi:ComF family protein
MKIFHLLLRYFSLFLKKLDTTHCNCGANGYIICPECLLLLPENLESPSKKIYCLYNYKNPEIKKIIHALKFESAWSYSSVFGEPLCKKIIELQYIYKPKNTYVLAMPISSEREYVRGYNQSEKLVSFIQEKSISNISFPKKILGRHNSSEYLSRLDKKERLKTVKDKFFIKDMSFIKNLSENDLVILIDDVTTTGSTFNELQKVISSTTSAFVVGLAVAH